MPRPRHDLSDALLSGLAGATALTLVHEAARRAVDEAPRMDVLGRRALDRGLDALGLDPPSREARQAAALAGDLVTNSLYYGLVGLGPPEGALARGAALGAAMGVGAVVLPPWLGLGRGPGSASAKTRALTVSWYLLGGLAAAAAYQALAGRRGR